jgi:hypothetical protein
MKPFVISAKQAIFGWPFYSIWNLVACREQQGREVKFTAAAIVVAVSTSGLWLAFWLTVGYLILLLVSA